MRQLKIFTFLCLLLCAASGAWAQSIAQLKASGALVSNDPKTGVVRFIGYDPQAVGFKPASPALQAMPLQAAAEQHMAEHASFFGLKEAASELKPIKHEVDRNGHASTRFQQYHQGIPIIAGEVIVNQTGQRQLTSVGGRTSPGLALDIKPVLTEKDAQDLAIQAMVKWYQLPADNFVASKPELSIYDPRLVSGQNFPAALVWRFDVTTKDLQPINEFFAIEAQTGLISLHFNQVPHAKNRLTYNANSTAALPGTLSCNESNPSCSGGTTDAVFAHRYAGATYDYYLNNFGRDSIDGAGMAIISTVDYCPSGSSCPYANANWSQSRNSMVYGHNYATGEDIVGHELTHGVTGYTSKLIYFYQSGAINESLSDIFGELIQQSDPNSTITDPSRKWRLAEDLPTGALRSMADPTLYNQPDKISSSKYYKFSEDTGGVHINSGVNNKAAYLMANGGVFNGFNVAGIGNYKTAQIYYKVQTSYLTSGSDYLDLYNYLNQACKVLMGSYGITLKDCASVSNATLAVEMYMPISGFSTDMCPAGKSIISTIFSDNFESGYSKWATDNRTGTTAWSASTNNPYTPNNSLYGPDVSSVTDFDVRFLNPVTLPANSFLHFNHAFNFETSNGVYYDGGVLEYSVNNGTSWVDISPLYSGGYPYVNTSIPTNFGNPLGGRLGFSGSTIDYYNSDYVSSRYDLSSLVGQSVKFRWRIGTDISGAPASGGWYVDDVSINQCGAVLPASPTNAFAEPGNASASVSFTPSGLGSGSFVSHLAACTDGSTTQMASGAQIPINVTGLVNGRSYTCNALTRSSVGDSSWSAASNIVTPGTAAAPTSVAASSLPLKAVVNFSAPTSTGSSALTGYTATCTAVGQTTQTATGTSSPITVKNLKPGVTYSCKVVANNSYGSGLESTTVQIKVRGVDLSAILSLLLDDETTAPSAPSISTQPAAISVVSGGNASFSVSVNGTGPFSYQWLRNAKPIPGATNATFTTPVTIGDSGAPYSVIISNSLGSVTSNTATLTVTPSNLTDLVISEVSTCYYFDIDCWFEIYNPTSQTKNLSNYSVKSLSVDTTVGGSLLTTNFSLPSINIAPDSYLIIAGNHSNIIQRVTQNIRLRVGNQVPFWTSNGFIELLNSGVTADFISFGNSAQSPTTSGKWSGAPVAALLSSATDYGKSIIRAYPRNADTDTNTAADWISVDWATPAGRNDVPIGALDADGDGIPDSAEVLGGTFGGLDLYSMGVRTGQKDILIEVDRMNSSDPGVIPRKESLQKVVDVFAAKSINVIFDAGTEFNSSFSKADFNFGQGNNVVPFEPCVTLNQTTCSSNVSNKRSLYDWKEENMDLRRRSVFHYFLFGSSQLANGASGSSGVAELPGNDFLISMGNWGFQTTPDSNLNLLINMQASTIMHELGHNLNLQHGGDEGVNYKPNYWSIMNYTYQLNGLEPDPTSITAYQRWRIAKGDGTPSRCNLVGSPCGNTTQFIMSYSDGTGTNLNESALAESANMGRGAATGAYADWNLNGALTTGTYSKDLNVDSSLGVLHDYNDWANIKLPFSRFWAGNTKLPNSQNIILQSPLDPISNDRQPYIQETTTAKDFLK